MRRYDIRFRYCTLFIACTILLFCSISASAGTITDSVVWGTWIMKYVMGNGADGLNASIDGGTRIYYIFNDDQMWGYSVFTDGTSDALAARSYSISDGKLEFSSGNTMDIFLSDGVLHLSESGTEMLFIRGDIDFLEGSWDYVAISDDTQPETVRAVNEFFALGGEINFTFKKRICYDHRFDERKDHRCKGCIIFDYF